ncbi:MAG: hypothetical protein D6B25_16140 [Desulfobulbaceae bacterium]|nr:MAG: hypothetical protein D6B25_16140 [Desulfobulbaceae bacterium]
MVAQSTITAQHFAASGNFPNNGKLPLLVYHNVFVGNEITPEAFENRFNSSHWPSAWRNGLFSYHHFHSTAHEALGIYSGQVQICFGGPGGTILKGRPGDAIIIPAGVSHCCVDQSTDLAIVGAYPAGTRPNMCSGTEKDYPRVSREIDLVPLPAADPLFGRNGILFDHWLP